MTDIRNFIDLIDHENVNENDTINKLSKFGKDFINRGNAILSGQSVDSFKGTKELIDTVYNIQNSFEKWVNSQGYTIGKNTNIPISLLIKFLSTYTNIPKQIITKYLDRNGYDIHDSLSDIKKLISNFNVNQNDDKLKTTIISLIQSDPTLVDRDDDIEDFAKKFIPEILQEALNVNDLNDEVSIRKFLIAALKSKDKELAEMLAKQAMKKLGPSKASNLINSVKDELSPSKDKVSSPPNASNANTDTTDVNPTVERTFNSRVGNTSKKQQAETKPIPPIEQRGSRTVYYSKLNKLLQGIVTLGLRTNTIKNINSIMKSIPQYQNNNNQSNLNRQNDSSNVGHQKSSRSYNNTMANDSNNSISPSPEKIIRTILSHGLSKYGPYDLASWFNSYKSVTDYKNNDNKELLASIGAAYLMNLKGEV